MGFLNPNNWFAGQNDPTAATNMNGGQPVAPGQLAYQGVTPGSGQNSLEQYIRSLTNSTGQQGNNILNNAQGYINTGTGGVNQSMGYWGDILSGNKAQMAQALSPELQASNAQFQNSRNALNTFAPMGGGRASAMGQLPFQQAQTNANIIASLRPQAAQQLGQLGMGQQNFGMGQQGVGTSLLGLTLQSLLGQRGQDVTETGQNKALGGQLGNTLLNPFAQGLAKNLIGSPGGSGGNI